MPELGDSKEILSQEEIDRLLAALASGNIDEVTEKKKEEIRYRKYDFRRPNKFSKENLRTLHLIHDNYARLISNFLTGYLRTNISVKVASVDQATYEDFLVSVPTPTLITTFKLHPLKGSMVMETNLQFIFPIISLLFGGSGDMPPEVRELTDIELAVIKKLNYRLLENLAQAWAEIIKVEPEIEALENNPRLHQVLSPNEIVAIITFTTEILGNNGLINLCLPFEVLDPLLAKLSASYWFSHATAADREAFARHMEGFLAESELEVSAILGGTELRVREFLKIEVGDIVVLNRKVDEELELFVEDQKLFKVQPGRVGEKLCCQITGMIERDEADG
ncbi:flagellar motor switch protein FliM [Carboxydothermus hydrogenoformans]|uniref:Flagellar motor switch protein FliM n=1 Tax=Carboxydothermus hydrogenoformans (strain ATCC BAA-161 / DSM 6008 / Z-2901) TaxID=246194 RepID=Q3ADB8_CARHZ|nr:flagellar motor switch protein FliM [Carboxydothermus hydrogenoformans]ABB15888.1 flagellar motor switch protein FliM [Carboxydothermus hydrogenoformans Z-2901]